MFRKSIMLTLLLASQIVSADILRRGLGPEPDSLDIHQAQGLAALQVLRDSQEGLLTFGPRGNLVAGVAQSWEVDEAGLMYEFQLRRDARWSNGDPVLADDFVRAWQLATAPATQARTAGLLSPVARAREVMAGKADPVELGIRALDEYRLQVRLEKPAPWFLEILTHPVSFPLHDSSYTNPSKRPSNGAFKIVESVPHAYIRLDKNDSFHAADTVQIEQVEYLPIEDSGSELSRYRANEIHITESIPPGRYQWLNENLGDQLRISPYIGSFWLGINLRSEPLGDSVDLRRALSLAIDRETLVRVVTGAGELPAWGIVPPGLESYEQQPDSASKMDKAAREAQAKTLYQRAGYSEANPLRIELRFNTSSQHRRMAVAVSAMWKQVLGVRTSLIHEEWKVFVNNRRHGSLTEVFRGGWIADYADPTSFLDLFRADEELNTTFYTNESFDRLMDQAAARSGLQRTELLQQAEVMLLRDVPVIPLYYYVSRHLVKPEVTGYEDNARDVHLSRYLGLGEPQP